MFNIAVLVSLAGLNLPALQTIVTQQRLVTPGEGLGIEIIIHGCRQAVRLMRSRHTAEFPKTPLCWPSLRLS